MTETAAIRAVTLDVAYPSGFYGVQAPVMLEYAARLAGVARPHPARPFHYLDIGCGDGFTIILLAAAYPQGSFIGIDLNPDTIARGRDLIARAGLANVRLYEADITAWRDLDLPICDYIALHGVYAWISEPVRLAIDRLIGDRLAPDGMAYLGYNAEPGWGVMAPVRQFLIDYALALGPGDALTHLRAGLGILRALRDKQADFFAGNPLAAMKLEDLLHKDPRYVAHEIFAPHWQPLSFGTVSARLGRVGLVAVSTPDFHKISLKHAIKRAHRPLFTPGMDRDRQELLRDMLCNTWFRRDIFVRAPDGGLPAPLPPHRLMDDVIFGAKLPKDEQSSSVEVADGPISLLAEPYATFTGRLERGAAAWPTLAALFAGTRIQPADLWAPMGVLTLGYQIAPFATVTDRPTTPLDDWQIPLAINRHLIEGPMTQDPYLVLVSPVAGTGFGIAHDDGLILSSVAAVGPDAAAAYAWAEPSRRKWLRDDRGHAYQTAEKFKAAFETMLVRMRKNRLTKYQELGLIAPRNQGGSPCCSLVNKA